VLRSVIRRCVLIRSAARSRRCEVVRGVVERRAGDVRGAVHQTTTAERLVVDGRAPGKNSMVWRRGSRALGRSLVLAFDLRSRVGGTERRARVDGSHRHSRQSYFLQTPPLLCNILHNITSYCTPPARF